jgi:hypothetical protein
MTRWATGIRVSVTRYLGDEPQPGVVECEFTDAKGQRWTFVEKTTVVTDEDLDARSSYPRAGVIACEIVSLAHELTGKGALLVNTERPWGIAATDGTTTFSVLPSALVGPSRRGNPRPAGK